MAETLVLDQDDSLGGERFSGEERGHFDSVDGFGGAIQYKTEKFLISAGYQQSQAYELNESEDINKIDGEVWSIYTAYSPIDEHQFYFGFDDGSKDTNDIGDDTIDGQAYHFGYTSKYFDNFDLWGVYSFIDLDEKVVRDGNVINENAERHHFAFGMAYHLTARTRFYAEFGFVNRELGEDTDTQYIGIRHDF